MNRIIPVTRILLGLAFVVFSLNYFIPFLPPQGDIPAPALGFIGAFAGAGMLTLVKVIELVAGIALLANRAVPLALTLLAPILVGIAWFHAALAPAGTGIAVVLVVLELVAAWGYRSAFAPMLAWRHTPDAVTGDAPVLATR